jgi:chromosome segregation ATPase
MRKQIGTVVVILGICLAGILFQSRSSAEAQQSGDPLSTSLIGEIRELRLALQTFTVSNYRAQIAIEQLRSQQERVDHLNEEIENVRVQIESCVSESQQASETAKILEKQAGFTSDPLQRLSLEQEHKLTLARIEECKRREQRLRERETQLNGQIQTEQSALNDVKDRMNSLERSLEVNQNSRRK